MGQCSTLIYLINNQHSISERMVDIGQFCAEMDTDLQKVFGGIELEVDANVVQKTISKIKENL
jgi:hypothetical protein